LSPKKNKSIKTNASSKVILKSSTTDLKIKESNSSKYNSFIAIYDLSYRLREQKPYMHSLEDSSKKTSDRDSECFSNGTGFENKDDGQKANNNALSANSTNNSYKDIINRVLKSNVSITKSDLK
jgi:hypothetical protein